MSHFYGTLQGNRGGVTRCGTKGSGMQTICASWAGAVKCSAYIDDDGLDCVSVEFMTWYGKGSFDVIYRGPISGFTKQDHGAPLFGVPSAFPPFKLSEEMQL